MSDQDQSFGHSQTQKRKKHETGFAIGIIVLVFFLCGLLNYAFFHIGGYGIISSTKKNVSTTQATCKLIKKQHFYAPSHGTIYILAQTTCGIITLQFEYADKTKTRPISYPLPTIGTEPISFPLHPLGVNLWIEVESGIGFVSPLCGVADNGNYQYVNPQSVPPGCH